MEIQTLAHRFYDYLLYFRGNSKSTIKRNKYALELYCRFANVRYLEEVTEENIRNFFFYGRTKRDWKPATFQIIHKSLKGFFRWCISEGYLYQNPTNDIEVPKIPKRLPAKLTKQQAMRLLEIVYNYPYEYKFVRYRNHAMFSMFIFAGLRKHELLNLKYADVDVQNLSIFVNQGKGGKDRVIPMNYALARSLDRYLEHRKRLKRTCPEFFVSLRMDCGFTEHGLEHFVKDIRKASGMRFTIHQLRHTFATLMLEGGCDIFSLSKMMGHSEITTTTIYLAASPEHLRGQMMKHPLGKMVA